MSDRTSIGFRNSLLCWLLLTAVALTVVGACLYETDRRSRSTETTLQQQLQSEHARVDRALESEHARIDRALEGIGLLASTFYADAFRDIAGRSAVPCVPHGRSAVLLIAGQSNAGNLGDGPRRFASPNVLNYNLFDRQCYPAQDPLLGTSGDGANWATVLGDLLIKSGAYDSVILVPIAVGSTRIEQWVPGAVHHPRFLVALAHLYSLRLLPTAVLWQQGEGNDVNTAAEIKDYSNALRSIVTSVRGHWGTAPFYAALSTRCGGECQFASKSDPLFRVQE